MKNDAKGQGLLKVNAMPQGGATQLIGVVKLASRLRAYSHKMWKV